jgi:hypothetical protein
LRAVNARLVEEASALGKSRKGEGVTRLRERQDVDALAAEFIAYAREGGKLLEDGDGPDAEATRRAPTATRRSKRSIEGCRKTKTTRKRPSRPSRENMAFQSDPSTPLQACPRFDDFFESGTRTIAN